MPRAPRKDEPGAWFHVMNRAIAKRTAFPDRRSIRVFLALLVNATRWGLLEVHAFSVMSTHYHLLVRSPIGEMSEAMRRTQNLYVRWFNRQLRRDGPLFRGRFLSKRIDSLDYRRAVVRYIDANAVEARLVARSEDYPFASTGRHLHGTAPLWLRTEWIAEEVLRASNRLSGRPKARPYFLAFPRAEDPSRLLWVEQRLHSRRAWSDPFQDLTDFAPDSVMSWMKRKADLADGTSPSLPSVAVRELETHLLQARRHLPTWTLPNHPDERIWLALRIALLRDLCGLTWSEIARLTGRSRNALMRTFEFHRRLLDSEPTYASRAADLAAQLLSP